LGAGKKEIEITSKKFKILEGQFLNMMEDCYLYLFDNWYVHCDI